jgi:hypothetical protein
MESAVLSLELEVPEAKLLEAFCRLTLQQRMRLLEMVQDLPFANSPFVIHDSPIRHPPPADSPAAVMREELAHRTDDLRIVAGLWKGC